MKVDNARTVWIDNIRVIATIAVIIVHVATQAVFTKYDPHSTTNTEWWIGNVYDSLCRFCVPAFVMLTGALLLPQKISLGTFLQKRLKRILLPFVFWSLIYIAFNLVLKVRDEGMQMAFQHSRSWLLLQITEGAAPHLWYVYMIIGLYLFIPIIQPWVSGASNKALLYFLAIWFVSLLLHQQNILTVNSPLNLNYFSGYIGYLIIGYFIAKRGIISPTGVYFAIILFFTGVGITIAGTYYTTLLQRVFSHVFYEYLTFNVLLAAIGFFMICAGMPFLKNNATAGWIRSLISKYGYGIYLSHLLILNILSHFGVNYSLITPIVGIPLTSLICFTGSAVTVHLINKLPYGRYVSG